MRILVTLAILGTAAYIGFHYYGDELQQLLNGPSGKHYKTTAAILGLLLALFIAECSPKPKKKKDD